MNWLTVVAFVVGALTAVVANLLIEVYKTRQHALGAMRLLEADLVEARDMIRNAIDLDEWWADRWKLPTETWFEERACLAKYGTKEWSRIAHAFRDLTQTNGWVETRKQQPDGYRDVDGVRTLRYGQLDSAMLKRIRPHINDAIDEVRNRRVVSFRGVRRLGGSEPHSGSSQE